MLYLMHFRLVQWLLRGKKPSDEDKEIENSKIVK